MEFLYSYHFRWNFRFKLTNVVVLTWVDTHGVEPGLFRGTAFTPNSGGLRSHHNSHSLRELWSLQNYILYYFNKKTKSASTRIIKLHFNNNYISRTVLRSFWVKSRPLHFQFNLGITVETNRYIMTHGLWGFARKNADKGPFQVEMKKIYWPR